MRDDGWCAGIEGMMGWCAGSEGMMGGVLEVRG